jgi:hypothetical protein
MRKFERTNSTTLKVAEQWPAEPTTRVAYLLYSEQREKHWSIYLKDLTRPNPPGRTTYWGVEYFWLRRKAHALEVWDAFKEALVVIGSDR